MKPPAEMPRPKLQFDLRLPEVPAPLARYTPVYVEWMDAASDSAWYATADIEADPETSSLSRCKTLGFFIAETNDMLILGQTIDVDGDHVSNVFRIPKSCITVRYHFPNGQLPTAK